MYFREDIDNNIYIECSRDPLFILGVKEVAEKYLEYKELLQKYTSDKYFIVVKYAIFEDYEENKDIVTTCYKDIDNLNIAPKLVDIVKLNANLRLGKCENDIKEYFIDVSVIYCIITEKYGVSLLEKYLNNDRKKYGGPGAIATNISKHFDVYFPDTIPSHIRKQVVPLLDKMKQAGWYHDDVHAGNFVVDNDIVKIIDFECVSEI